MYCPAMAIIVRDWRQAEAVLLAARVAGTSPVVR